MLHAYQPGRDQGCRRRPKTKYDVGTTPAELTSATTAAHIHFRPRIWLAALIDGFLAQARLTLEPQPPQRGANAGHSTSVVEYRFDTGRELDTIALRRNRGGEV